MYYVKLNKPIPGIRSTIFVFYTNAEASEFQSCLYVEYGDGWDTEMGVVGEPTEVFPEWSF